MPPLNIVDVASLRPGSRSALVEEGATFAATAPRTIDTGIGDTCSEEGNSEATIVPAEAVATAAATPGACFGSFAKRPRIIVHTDNEKVALQRRRSGETA